MHIENVQERHFLEIKKIQRQESDRIGREGGAAFGGIGVLLIALAHGKCSYSTPLLNPPTQGGYSRLPRNVF